jgi:RimJ/RimL family protein N-acetyltransferase
VKAIETDRLLIRNFTALANEPSCRLLQRLGFKETGRGTGSLRKTPEGKPVEFASVSFALSREEWLARRQSST